MISKQLAVLFFVLFFFTLTEKLQEWNKNMSHLNVNC